MDNSRMIRADEISTGNKKDVRLYKEGRRCRLCNSTLGIYTPGPCCLLHTHQWTIMQLEKKEDRIVKRKAMYERQRKTKLRKKREYKDRMTRDWILKENPVGILSKVCRVCNEETKTFIELTNPVCKCKGESYDNQDGEVDKGTTVIN